MTDTWRIACFILLAAGATLSGYRLGDIHGLIFGQSVAGLIGLVLEKLPGR